MLRSQIATEDTPALRTYDALRPTWPDAVTFREAVQTPALTFNDSSLRASTLYVDQRGLPVAYAGRFAVVFRVTLPDGEPWAVRCFTTPGEENASGRRRARQRRYQAIEPYVNAERSVFVPFRYLDEGIKVAGKWYPALAMRWASGVPLGRWVEKNRRNPQALRTLSASLSALLIRLEASGIAHGDWQHDNLLVSDNGERITLVDYDGMYVPELAGEKSAEMGHPNYQHPRRTAQDFGPGLDRFSCLVMQAALLGMAQEPALWEKYSDGESLLFKKSDFTDPEISPVLYELRRIAESRHDVRLADAVARLEDACHADPMATLAPDSAATERTENAAVPEYAPIHAGTLSQGVAQNGTGNNGHSSAGTLLTPSNGQRKGGKWWAAPESVRNVAAPGNSTFAQYAHNAVVPAEHKFLAQALSAETLKKEAEHLRTHRIAATVGLAVILTLIAIAVWTRHFYFLAFFGWMFNAGPFGYSNWPRKKIAEELDAEIKKIEALIHQRNEQIDVKLRASAVNHSLKDYTDEWLRRTSIFKLYDAGNHISTLRSLQKLGIENAYDLQRVPLTTLPTHQATAFIAWTRTVEEDAAADYRKLAGRTTNSPASVESLRHEIAEFERYLLQLKRQKERFPDVSVEKYLAYLLGRSPLDFAPSP